MMMNKGAVFADRKFYRYVLWRIWDDRKQTVTFICLNPSTANEAFDDPTVNKIMGFAARWNGGGIYVVNLFAIISSNPAIIFSVNDAVGPENDRYVREYAAKSAITVAGWGDITPLNGRDVDVIQMVPGLKCLGKTKSGQPKHPLYVKWGTAPVDLGIVVI